MERLMTVACAAMAMAVAIAPVVCGQDDQKAGASAATRKAAQPPLAKPKDDPNLPRVLIIGDSISIGYTPWVAKYLQGRANVHHPPGNCQHTACGLANLESWLGKEKWDVIHFNWGIWDTHLLDAKTGKLIQKEDATDPNAVRIRHDAQQYEDNLRKLVKTLKGTGARLVWASTTPVMSRKGERRAVIPAYNEIAARVMKENGIPIDDLYSAAVADALKWQTDGCHFNAAGCEYLGKKVGDAILAALGGK